MIKLKRRFLQERRSSSCPKKSLRTVRFFVGDRRMTDSKRTINAATALYGIMGNPVHHSLSPFVHNTLFERFKINSVYMAFPVERNSLGLAFEAMRAMGMRGANITIPFKEEAVGFVDEIPEDLDRCVGAINTVVNRNGQLHGYNTDSTGFLVALKEELGFNPEAKKILVLGAGGAARAVVFALARAHADEIIIHNRTVDRAEGLSDYVSGYFPEIEIDVIPTIDLADSKKPDLVVNATSYGMTPPSVSCDPKGIGPHSAGETDGGVKAIQGSPFDLRLLTHKAGVYDVIYSPAETPLLKQAKKLALPHANGLGMLAAQAALSFELWTGEKEGVREAIREALKKCFIS